MDQDPLYQKEEPFNYALFSLDESRQTEEYDAYLYLFEDLKDALEGDFADLDYARTLIRLIHQTGIFHPFAVVEEIRYHTLKSQLPKIGDLVSSIYPAFSQSPTVLSAAGQWELSEGNAAAAYQRFAKALDYLPNCQSALLGCADCALRLGDLEKAAVHIHHLTLLRPYMREAELLADQFETAQAAAMEEERVRGAYPGAENVRRSAEALARARSALAKSALSQAKSAHIIQYIPAALFSTNAAICWNEENAEAYRIKALLHQKNSQAARAFQAYQLYLQKKGLTPGQIIASLDQMIESGDYEKAKAKIREMEGCGIYSYAFSCFRGRIYQLTARWGKALHCYYAALSLAKNNPKCEFNPALKEWNVPSLLDLSKVPDRILICENRQRHKEDGVPMRKGKPRNDC